MKGSEKIKKILEWKQINANQLAKALGMKRTQGLYDIIDGTIDISKKMAANLKKLYPELSISWLLGDDTQMLLEDDSRLLNTFSSEEIHELEKLEKKNPLTGKVSKEWAVIRLLGHEIAALRAEVTHKAFRDCLDELNDKIQQILRAD